MLCLFLDIGNQLPIFNKINFIIFIAFIINKKLKLVFVLTKTKFKFKKFNL